MEGATYTILIKSAVEGTGGSNKPTVPTPRKPKPTKPSTQQNGFMEGFKSFTKGINAFKSAISKFAPVAVVVGVAKALDSAAGLIIPFYTAETGDYSYQNVRNNLHATVNAFFNPFSTTLNYIRYYQSIRLHNNKAQEERLLLGDSTINYNFGKAMNV